MGGNASFALPHPVFSVRGYVGTSRRAPGCYAVVVNGKSEIDKSNMTGKQHVYIPGTYAGTIYVELQQVQVSPVDHGVICGCDVIHREATHLEYRYRGMGQFRPAFRAALPFKDN